MSRMPTARCNSCGNYLHTAETADTPDRAWLLVRGFRSRGRNRFYHPGLQPGDPVVTVDLFPDGALLGVVECKYIADQIDDRKTVVSTDPTTGDVEGLLAICHSTYELGRRSPGQ